MHFSSRDGKAIDAFIDTAYEWYVGELKKAEKKNCRYFYELKTGASKSDGGDDEYSRYQLSDEKTFDSLFFPEKENLLKLLKHFMNRSGKYAIKGYPHKLGILLHGPPGTGTWYCTQQDKQRMFLTVGQTFNHRIQERLL
jgi:chaperone BCS1